jgi:putative two-component system response regulator
LTAFVEDLGYEAVTAVDGEAALRTLATKLPDIVLSDVNMPRMNGYELCRRLKGDLTTRLIPVILITGVGDEHKAEGIEAGADDFLSKPFMLGELRIRLRSFLRMKAFTDELESAETVLMTLARSIEAKDPYTEGHCERLAAYGVALGAGLGAGEEMLTALRRGGFLHDLGKVGVPEAILLKEGALTVTEREILKRHPQLGEEICRPLKSLSSVLPIIRNHHEKWDGSGYPDGLRGTAIPLGARILQVVDVFDALATDRPYRRALPRREAIEVLEGETRRGWWDPTVVGAFIQMAPNLRQEPR